MIQAAEVIPEEQTKKTEIEQTEEKKPEIKVNSVEELPDQVYAENKRASHTLLSELLKVNLTLKEVKIELAASRGELTAAELAGRRAA